MDIKAGQFYYFRDFGNESSPFHRSVDCAKSKFKAVIVGYSVPNQPKTYSTH